MTTPFNTQTGGLAIRRVLLTGATGFVGAHLHPALLAAGCDVVCATRRVNEARREHPERTWVELDVEKPETIARAMSGCDAAFYLIHGMGQGADYPAREAASAKNFVRAATDAGVGRIVYLGGVLPAGKRASKHLASRQHTGECLRGGEVSTIELRAAMIIGAGSISWTMVRDLAARLPAMLLPRWLRNHSHPVAIDDVIWGLLHALFDPRRGSAILELPGPERISHRDLLNRVARLLGHKRVMINVPVLTPRLSSYWIALVTRVSLELAKELVEGVRFDLDPVEETAWASADRQPLAIEEAARLAIIDAEIDAIPSPQAAERARRIGLEMAAGPSLSRA